MSCYEKVLEIYNWRIIIFDKSKKVAADLKAELKKYKFKIVDEDPELVISVGGDGSFLRMVKEMRFNPNIYYIGVNSGTLGFLQEINIKDCKDFVERLNSNKYKIEDISVEETRITANKHVYKYISLNERLSNIVTFIAEDGP